MFEIERHRLQSKTDQLLYNIWQKLRIFNNPVPATREQTRDFESMGRSELMALVKELPVKPERWSQLKNEELVELLKEGA